MIYSEKHGREEDLEENKMALGNQGEVESPHKT